MYSAPIRRAAYATTSRRTTRRSPKAMEMMIAGVMALNVIMIAVMFIQGFSFLRSNPGTVDEVTAAVCAVVALLTTAWAVVAARGLPQHIADTQYSVHP
jgi:protein-S-isoprenylcysteine O-methyltransferase Ste14